MEQGPDILAIAIFMFFAFRLLPYGIGLYKNFRIRYIGIVYDNTKFKIVKYSKVTPMGGKIAGGLSILLSAYLFFASIGLCFSSIVFNYQFSIALCFIPFILLGILISVCVYVSFDGWG